MAIQYEELLVPEATVYRFPTHLVRVRAARRAAQARRRMVLGVGAVLVAAFLLAGGPEGSATASNTGAPRVVTVHAGDTLWGIAARFAPDSVDPRAYIDVLEERNDLTG